MAEAPLWSVVVTCPSSWSGTPAPAQNADCQVRLDTVRRACTAFARECPDRAKDLDVEWVIGVDVGGTFTDLHAEDGQGRTVLHKTPSTNDNPARAILDGLHALCERHGVDPAHIARLSHGTTVATNALIQRRGGTVALVVTRGFRDLIEIGRQTRPSLYDLQRDHPPPLVPRDRRFELDERMRADGTAARVPGPEHLRQVAHAVVESGCDAVAVCLLFSFLDPTHERAVAAALRALRPDLPVSLSSEVQPEFREYERLSTTVLNAYLQPVMSRYIAALEGGVRAVSPGAKVGINQSSGGLMSAARARRFPVRTALSGPAAGAMGALDVARRAGEADVITLDMGGTSADVALMRGLAPGTAFERAVEGFPVRLPSLDINAVGAGGGSVAWFDRDGLLKVGPESAGADPGPACYGRGGTRPTVTDANLVLGRLSAGGLLGGAMALDPVAARAALVPAADRLGFPVERTAHGILEIVVSNMVRAIRAVSVERGIDPRGFVLLPFGGAGPLHAAAVARSLGMRRVLVPPAPGILCAQGLIISDLKESFVRTAPARLGPDLTLRPVLAGQHREDERWLEDEGVAPGDRRTQASLDMRYVGQNFEIQVPASEADDADTLRRRFFAQHETTYGYHNPFDPVEVVNWRLTATGRLARPEPAGPSPGPAGQPAATRAVWFGPHAPVETGVYDRGVLAPGAVLTGPAVIEQLDATTLLFPGDSLSVDAQGAMLIEVAA